MIYTYMFPWTDVFRNFKKGEEFFCFSGQSTQAVTGMYNLFRASQLVFPGENILEAAKDFSSRFLREKQANNDLVDKWIITKDLPGEVRIIFGSSFVFVLGSWFDILIMYIHVTNIYNEEEKKNKCRTKKKTIGREISL